MLKRQLCQFKKYFRIKIRNDWLARKKVRLVASTLFTTQFQWNSWSFIILSQNVTNENLDFNFNFEVDDLILILYFKYMKFYIQIVRVIFENFREKKKTIYECFAQCRYSPCIWFLNKTIQNVFCAETVSITVLCCRIVCS